MRVRLVHAQSGNQLHRKNLEQRSHQKLQKNTMPREPETSLENRRSLKAKRLPNSTPEASGSALAASCAGAPRQDASRSALGGGKEATGGRQQLLERFCSRTGPRGIRGVSNGSSFAHWAPWRRQLSKKIEHNHLNTGSDTPFPGARRIVDAIFRGGIC